MHFNPAFHSNLKAGHNQGWDAHRNLLESPLLATKQVKYGVLLESLGGGIQKVHLQGQKDPLFFVVLHATPLPIRDPGYGPAIVQSGMI